MARENPNMKLYGIVNPMIRLLFLFIILRKNVFLKKTL